jgi:hypothetical protein
VSSVIVPNGRKVELYVTLERGYVGLRLTADHTDVLVTFPDADKLEADLIAAAAQVRQAMYEQYFKAGA